MLITIFSQNISLKKGELYEYKIETIYKNYYYIYISFGFLWIIFSDKIVHLLTNNLDLYATFQTYKGLFFILFTSLLLFRMIENQLKKDKEVKQIIVKKDLRLEQINNNMNHLFDLSMKMLSPIGYDDKDFIKQIFKIAYTISEESNLGSAYILNDCKVDFIDSFGFDLKTLNKMDSDMNLYKKSPEKLILNKNSSLENIKESIYVGIYQDENLIGGFNLHINKNSNKSYSDDVISRIQMVQTFSNGLYRIKKYEDYKLILQNDIVQSFITALEFHDDYTKGHSDLVAVYSMKIGEALKLDKKQLEDLYWAALMHDIGKIIIPIDVLNKTGRLTDSEFDLIKKHPKIGYEIISRSKTLKKISKYVLSHHERWDGKGYPNGLKGDEIPLLSPIISVADSWHAMTSERPYKNKLNKEEGIKELIKYKGTQFSPDIVDVFLKILKNYKI